MNLENGTFTGVPVAAGKEPFPSLWHERSCVVVCGQSGMLVAALAKHICGLFAKQPCHWGWLWTALSWGHMLGAAAPVKKLWAQNPSDLWPQPVPNLIAGVTLNKCLASLSLNVLNRKDIHACLPVGIVVPDFDPSPWEVDADRSL